MNVKVFLVRTLLWVGLGLLASCSDDDQPGETTETPEAPLALALEKSFTIPACQVLDIKPTVTGPDGVTYRWTSGETLLSDSAILEFIQVAPGTYKLTLTAATATQEQIADCQVTVTEAAYEVSSMKLLAYKPGMHSFRGSFRPNAFELPYAEFLENYQGYRSKLNHYQNIILGTTGGYAVFGFDHTIVNLPDSLDFSVTVTSDQSGMGDNSIYRMYVAYDKNKNGQPDEEEWFEIKGSQYGTSNEVADYEITYADYTLHEGNFEGMLAAYYSVDWTDNQGNHGDDFIIDSELCNEDPPYDFRGVIPGLKQENGTPIEGWEQLPFTRKGKVFKVIPEDKQGYLYVASGADQGVLEIDIDWAVDKNGNQVCLPGIDFVKVQNVTPKENEHDAWAEGRIDSWMYVIAKDIHLDK